MGYRSSILRGGSLVTIAVATGWSGVALAQSNEVPSAEEPVAESQTLPSTTVFDENEPIIVTAQRQEQAAQDVPISIIALDGDELQTLGLDSVQDIQLATPGLTYESGYGFAQPYIRGIGTSQPNPGLESAVASYLNGAYLVRSYGQIGPLFDMQSIEILRGAQGTLWGRNATGGAILYTTAQPEIGVFSVDGSAEYGRFDHVLGQVAVNAPLGDTLAIRLGIQASNDDGFVTNIVNGDDWGGGDHLLLRGSILWEPSDSFTVSGMFEVLEDTRFVNHFAERARAPLCGSCAIPGGGFNPVTGFYDIAFGPTAEPTDVTGDTAIIRLNYDAGNFEVTSVSSYRKDRAVGVINVAGSSIPFQDFFADSGGRTWAEEIQLVTNFDGAFNGLVGYSYSDDVSFNINEISGALVLNVPGITSENFVYTTSHSVFGELYITPLDRLSLTLGLRYTSDDREFRGSISPITALFFAPGNPTPADFGNSESFSEFTPRVVVSYDLDNVNLYANYNRGFKQGGYNTPNFNNDLPVNPETVDYFETGMKFVSDDNRLRFNVAGFYYKYSDIQVSIVNLASGANVLQNAASAEGYGLDIDGSFSPTPWFNLFGGMSLLHTEFLSYPAASIVNVTPAGIVSGFADLAGERLPRAPSFQASLGMNIDAPINDDWSVNFTALGSYTSGYDFFPGAQGPDAYAQQSGYFLANLSGYLQRDLGSRGYYRIGFYVNNVTDREYYSLRTAQAFIGLLDVAAPPRTFGIRLAAGF